MFVSVDGRCWVAHICRFSTRILRSKAPKLQESRSLELVQEVESLQSRGNLVGEGIPLVSRIVSSMVAAELTFAASIHVSSCSVRLRILALRNSIEAILSEEILFVSGLFFFFFGDALATSVHVSFFS